MKSPCLTCKLRYNPKDNGVCEECPSRIAYIAWIEGAEHMIPTASEPQQIKPPANPVLPEPEPEPEPVEIRKCRECGIEGPAAELFSKNRRGYYSMCKKCQGAKIQAGRIAAAKKKDNQPAPAAKSQPPAEKTCRACGRTGPVGELFQRNVKSKDGYLHICKTCHRASMRGGRNIVTGENVIHLDLPEDLLAKLNTMAAAQLRTPANMIMWLIKTYEPAQSFMEKVAVNQVAREMQR